MTARMHVHALAAACAVALSGCAAPPKPLYEWEGYPSHLYVSLRGSQSDVPAQIAAMEKDLEKIHAKGASVPPGYQAHLGYLHLSAGEEDRGLACLQAEAAAFPEFAPYMKLLLSRSIKK